MEFDKTLDGIIKYQLIILRGFLNYDMLYFNHPFIQIYVNLTVCKFDKTHVEKNQKEENISFHTCLTYAQTL